MIWYSQSVFSSRWLLISIILIKSIVFINSTPAYANVPSDAVWVENAITVAGRANGTAGTSNYDLNSARGLTITTDNILYVADYQNNRVVMVNLISTQVIGILGAGQGSATNQFYFPRDVFINNAFMYVFDSYNYRIQKWPLNGTSGYTVASTAAYSIGFYIFMDKYNNLYVSLYYNSRIICFAANSSASQTVAGTGTAGSQPDQLNTPDGIFIDDNLTMYIADYGNHRIQMWKYGASNGSTVAGTGVAGTSLTQLGSPTSVIVDKNGYMYITDEGNNRILRWQINSTFGVCIAACTGITGNKMNQLHAPVSLAFGNDGSMYVTDYFNNRVQKFQIVTNQSQIASTGQTTTTTMTTSISSSFSATTSKTIIASQMSSTNNYMRNSTSSAPLTTTFKTTINSQTSSTGNYMETPISSAASTTIHKSMILASSLLGSWVFWFAVKMFV